MKIDFLMLPGLIKASMVSLIVASTLWAAPTCHSHFLVSMKDLQGTVRSHSILVSSSTCSWVPTRHYFGSVVTGAQPMESIMLFWSPCVARPASARASSSGWRANACKSGNCTSGSIKLYLGVSCIILLPWRYAVPSVQLLVPHSNAAKPGGRSALAWPYGAWIRCG